jgi:hypothetical protein
MFLPGVFPSVLSLDELRGSPRTAHSRTHVIPD